MCVSLIVSNISQWSTDNENTAKGDKQSELWIDNENKHMHASEFLVDPTQLSIAN